jgi:tRNA pseudouridine38-40 synthase
LNSDRTLTFLVEYDGSNFSGWQTQPRQRTVQETIEKVLGQVLRRKTSIVGASRTDAGVHALGQTVHFRTNHPITCERLRIALNGLLPRDVSVREVKKAPVSFHAKNKAKKKTYLYRIWNSKNRSPLLEKRAWHVWSSLDLSKMRKAARFLVGEHDFSAFRGTDSDTKTSVRRILKISLVRKNHLLQISITGNGFLKYMVRNIVGTLVEVGKGRRSPEEVREILRSRDRKKAGATAPASGLYLMKVFY